MKRKRYDKKKATKACEVVPVTDSDTFPRNKKQFGMCCWKFRRWTKEEEEEDEAIAAIANVRK